MLNKRRTNLHYQSCTVIWMDEIRWGEGNGVDEMGKEDN